MQIGEQLKEAREQNNLTLDDIQATTKIQKRYLVAIEQEDFHALPGRFYARAFIKEYANAVGLDSEVLLASFDEDNIEIENEEEEAISYSRLKRTENKGFGKDVSILSYLPSIIVVLLIISILIIAWTLYQKSLSEPTGESIEEHESDEIIQRESGESQPIIDKEENDEEEVVDESEIDDEQETNDEAGDFTVVEEGTGNSPESTVSYTYGGDTLKVTLEATEEAYIQVKDESGVTHLDRLFTPGMTEELELSVESPIYFNVGHTPGMTIYINDDLLDYPISTDQSVHQKIWLNIN